MKEYKGFYVNENLDIYNNKNKKLKPFKGTDGYMQVTRHIGNHKYYHCRVHRLYATIFIPNPNNYNIKHAWDNICTNRKHKYQINVYKDNKFIKTYSSIRKLSEELKLDRHKISLILQNKIKNNYSYTFKYLESQSTIPDECKGVE